MVSCTEVNNRPDVGCPHHHTCKHVNTTQSHERQDSQSRNVRAFMSRYCVCIWRDVCCYSTSHAFGPSVVLPFPLSMFPLRKERKKQIQSKLQLCHSSHAPRSRRGAGHERKQVSGYKSSPTVLALQLTGPPQDAILE